MDNTRTVEGSSFDKLVGGSEAWSGISKTIEAANNAVSTRPILTVEEREELESRGLNPYFDKNVFRKVLATNAYENVSILHEPTQQMIKFALEEITDETNKANGSQEKQQEAIDKTDSEAEKLRLSRNGTTVSGRTQQLSPIRSFRTVLDPFKE